MRDIDVSGTRWIINGMGGIIANPTAFKLLFDDTRMPLDRNLIAQRQTQIGQSTVRILSIRTVKVEDTFLHDIGGFITVPLAIRGSAKVSRYYGIGEVNDWAFQICPQLIPWIVAWA